jgi:ADP-ribose pyrophosphatase YjhB (NUDIX family)
MTTSAGHEAHAARQFGEPGPGAETDECPGSYAIVIDEDRVLVVDDGRRLSLPGGGAEPGESPLDALRRVLRDETGYEVADASLFQEARQWVTDEIGTAVNKHCSFFVVDLGDRDRLVTSDGVARWAPSQAAIDLMAEEASRWALSVALCAQAIVRTLGRTDHSPAA